MKTALSLILLSLLFAFPAHAIEIRECAGSGSDTLQNIIVLRINDGDTVTAKIGNKKEKIRLIGIDAPELGQVPWGKRAKDRLKKLITDSSWKVKVEYDVEKKDQYGRILGYLWTKDGKMVNYEMLKSGYAVIYTSRLNVCYVKEFLAAQTAARTGKAGIWTRGGLDQLPSEYKKIHPRH